MRRRRGCEGEWLRVARTRQQLLRGGALRALDGAETELVHRSRSPLRCAPFSCRRDAGLPVEYGVNYAGVRFMKERSLISEEEAERLEGGAVARAR